MSTFKPTEFDQDVNIAKTHPLKEMAWLLGGIIIFIVLFYVIMSVALTILIPRVSVETENKIWDSLHLSERYSIPEDSALKEKEEYLQALLDSLPAAVKPEGYNFKIHISDTEEINAYAIPGGHIEITTGLLNKIENENTLVSVIGHELGHFQNRDHLKGLGRVAGTMILGIALISQTGEASNIIGTLMSYTDLAYSRKDEAKADEWALETLTQHYGHAGGATDLFEIFQEEEKNSFLKLPAFMLSHPIDEQRIKSIEERILIKNLRSSSTKDLPWPAPVPETEEAL